MSESRRQYERLLVRITEGQKALIQSDADQRYPELHGPTQQKRNFSPALRDGIDFWFAHYDLFLSWITMRRQITTSGEETQP